jgi:hypothetical protein
MANVNNPKRREIAEIFNHHGIPAAKLKMNP